jgi:hypothetical protein
MKTNSSTKNAGVSKIRDKPQELVVNNKTTKKVVYTNICPEMSVLLSLAARLQPTINTFST